MLKQMMTRVIGGCLRQGPGLQRARACKELGMELALRLRLGEIMRLPHPKLEHHQVGTFSLATLSPEAGSQMFPAPSVA